MNQPYNSIAEMKLRILLLLHCTKNHLSSDMIAALDFITVYGVTFKVSDFNLHGDNKFKFSELPSRREKVYDALKELVKERLVDVVLSNGFCFEISDKGNNYIKDFDSPYSLEYSEIASKVIDLYGAVEESKLYKLIQSKSTISDGE